MSDPEDDLKRRVLDERAKGNVMVHGLPGTYIIAPIDDFIGQPTDGLLYDLNRLEEVALTLFPDPKWMNDFAVAIVIRALKNRLQATELELAEMMVKNAALSGSLAEMMVKNAALSGSLSECVGELATTKQKSAI